MSSNCLGDKAICTKSLEITAPVSPSSPSKFFTSPFAKISTESPPFSTIENETDAVKATSPAPGILGIFVSLFRADTMISTSGSTSASCPDTTTSATPSDGIFFVSGITKRVPETSTGRAPLAVINPALKFVASRFEFDENCPRARVIIGNDFVTRSAVSS